MGTNFHIMQIDQTPETWIRTLTQVRELKLLFQESLSRNQLTICFVFISVDPGKGFLDSDIKIKFERE